MVRLMVCAGLLLPLLAPPVCGEPMVDVGRVELLYGLAGQQVQFFVTGGDAVEVLNFYIQVADGGPEMAPYVGDPFPEARIRAPYIQAIDLIAGTIFEGNSSGQFGGEISLPQYRDANVTTASGTVAACGPTGSGPGLIAIVTFDTSMWGASSVGMEWDLLLTGLVGGMASTDFGPIAGRITNGKLVIVPEPATLVLLLTGVVVGLLAAKRRVNRPHRGAQ